MELQGRLVFQEQEEQYAFSLCRVVDAGTFDQSYELLGVLQVAVDRRGPERLAAGLRPWALATLATGGYGLGRFYAAFTTLDEDGEPYRRVTEEYVDWSGTEVLVPAGADSPPAGAPGPSAVDHPTTTPGNDRVRTGPALVP